MIFRCLLFSFLVSYCGSNSAQDKKSDGSTQSFVFGQSQSPIFEGGEERMRHIVDSLKTSENPILDKNTPCYVTVQLEIDSTGKVTNVQASYSDLPEEYVSEAVRIAKALPKWHPAINQQKKVSSIKLIRIPFGETSCSVIDQGYVILHN